MATTIPYSQFIGSNDPFPVLRTTSARIAEKVEQLTPDQIATPPAPGKWSIHEIVAHLADTELMFQVRLRMILFEDTPHLAAFDQDRWVTGWSREKERFDQSLERFRVLRESTVRLLENIPPHDLERTGVHSERGIQMASDYLIIIAGHDINHLSQIEGIRNQFNGPLE